MNRILIVIDKSIDLNPYSDLWPVDIFDLFNFTFDTGIGK